VLTPVLVVGGLNHHCLTSQVQILLDAGINVTSKKDQKNYYPLEKALASKHYREIIQVLIKTGAGINDLFMEKLNKKGDYEFRRYIQNLA